MTEATSAQRANRYAGQCVHCAFKVEAGAGYLFKVDGAWNVEHVGGCPDASSGVPWEDRAPRASSRRGRGSRYASRYVRCTHEDFPCCGCER
jgi:hypothetical protein